MVSRRTSLATVAVLGLGLIWTVRLVGVGDYAQYPQNAWSTAKESLSGTPGGKGGRGDTPHIDAYFEQAFAAAAPPVFPFPEVRAACAAADWDHNEAYVNCVGMAAGLTTIMSQVKTCFKMAIETGSHLVLPRMPLRDSHDLTQFNMLNSDAYLTYDQWFDVDHLRTQMQHACPRMKILHPDDVGEGKAVPTRRTFQILCKDALFYRHFSSYFWVGRPYKTFFNAQFQLHMDRLAADEANRTLTPLPVAENGGITLVDIDSEFLVFRITDDPTRRDLRLWTELAHLIRFRADVRTVTQHVAARLPDGGNYMGVHFRAENDSIWSSAEHQLGVDLDALDRAWALVGRAGEPKPPVFLACGDQAQIDMFAAAAAARGWTTVHKWKLLDEAGDAATTALLNGMAFDFQGAVDLGIMVRSRFFLGVQGSAFSSTVGNQRDVTGRYRGSSFEVPDEGARTHLFNDGDGALYACCL